MLNEYQHIIIACFDSFIIALSLLIIFLLICYVGKSNKENILQSEKYFLFIVFYAYHIYRRISIINTEEMKFDITYNNIFDLYVKAIFIYNFCISLFIYRNIKEPTHLLRSIIKKPLHIMYEVSIIIILIINGIGDYLLNNQDNLSLKMEILYLMIFLCFIAITLILIWKSKRLLIIYQFESKRKISTVLNCNIIISFLYFLLFLAEIAVIVPSLKNDNKPEYAIIYFQYPLQIISLCDILVGLFQIYISDCYLYLISKSKKMNCIFCLFHILFPSFHNTNKTANNISEFAIEQSDETLLSKSNYELLEDFLQKNNSNINSYYIEILDFIINTSLIGLWKMYDTIINSEDENFKFDEKIFTKNENKNDFAENQILSSMIDNGGVKCEEINSKVKTFYTKMVHNIFKEKKLNYENIQNSLISHHNEENGNCVSLLRKNILEENFKSFKSLSLKSYDKRLSIEIYPNIISEDRTQKKHINILLYNYLNYLFAKDKTYLPLIYGIFKVKINNFDELLFIITENSLNENTPINNMNNYFHIKKFEFPQTKTIDVEDENFASLFISHNPLMMENYDTFSNIFDEDILFLRDNIISHFNFSILYYMSMPSNDISRNSELIEDNENENFWTKKGHKVKIENKWYMLHFQFGRIFDEDNFTTKCCCCHRNENILNFSNELKEVFKN